MRIAIFLLFIAACTTLVQKPIEPLPDGRIALSWETKPERREWSDKLTRLIYDNLDYYSKASDIKTICPRWDDLNERHRIKAVAEFWVALFFYESSWNPKSQSVDVGTSGDRNTWSIGLGQISVVDQKSFGLKTSYTFDELITPFPNMELSHAIMMRQLARRNKLLLDNKDSMRYWAIILFSNKYQKISQVIERIKSNSECGG
jgi:hypothetical protein